MVTSHITAFKNSTPIWNSSELYFLYKIQMILQKYKVFKRLRVGKLTLEKILLYF